MTRSALPLSGIVGETGGAIVDAGPADAPDLPRILPMRAGSSYAGNGWIGIKETTASLLRGVDSLALLGGLLGFLALIAALSATWYREGR